MISTGEVSFMDSSPASMIPSTCETLCFILTCCSKPLTMLFVYSHCSHLKSGEHPDSLSSYTMTAAVFAGATGAVGDSSESLTVKEAAIEDSTEDNGAVV